MLEPRVHVRLGTSEVAVSRTIGATVVPLQEPVREIRQLYTRAIETAERVVYIESQYVAATAIVEAMARRLEQPDRPRLEVVIVVPERLYGRMEKAAIEVPLVPRLTSLPPCHAPYCPPCGYGWPEPCCPYCCSP